MVVCRLFCPADKVVVFGCLIEIVTGILVKLVMPAGCQVSIWRCGIIQQAPNIVLHLQALCDQLGGFLMQ